MSGISTLPELRRAIKFEYGNVIPAPPVMIRLFTDVGTIITDFDEIIGLAPEYFDIRGLVCVVVRYQDVASIVTDTRASIIGNDLVELPSNHIIEEHLESPRRRYYRKSRLKYSRFRR